MNAITTVFCLGKLVKFADKLRDENTLSEREIKKECRVRVCRGRRARVGGKKRSSEEK